MKFKENMPNPQMKGYVTIDILDAKTGEILEHHENPNIITYESQQALVGAVSAPNANTTVSSVSLGTDLGELSVAGTSITLTSPGTITRASGSWLTDGFIIGDYITLAGTVSNNTANTGLPVLQIGTVNTSTITLATGSVTINGVGYTLGTITSEGASTSVQVSRGSLLSPSAPFASYDESTMAAMSFAGQDLFDAPYPLLVGTINQTTVNFSVIIVGADVMALYPGTTSQIFTSAALKTGNGKVFAYQRFPQKSISSVVNIAISWSVGY